MELEIAREVAEKFFKKTGEIKVLAGERNPNFLLTTTAGKFVLKIHGDEEVSQIQIQQSALAKPLSPPLYARIFGSSQIQAFNLDFLSKQHNERSLSGNCGVNLASLLR